MTPTPDRDWADALAAEIITDVERFAHTADCRDLLHRVLATRLRTLKIESQNEAIKESTDRATAIIRGDHNESSN